MSTEEIFIKTKRMLVEECGLSPLDAEGVARKIVNEHWEDAPKIARLACNLVSAMPRLGSPKDRSVVEAAVDFITGLKRLLWHAWSTGYGEGWRAPMAIE